METSALLVNLGLVALAVNRVIEVIKPTIEKTLPAVYQDILIRVLSILVGIVVVVGGGETFNLLALSPVYGQLNPMAGLVITGIIVGAFANAWDTIAGLFERPAASSSMKSLKVETKTERTEPEIGLRG